MDKQVDFSIVIPAYNERALVQRAVTSVLRQESASFEIIITDDSSHDAIAQYVRQINDSRIGYYHHGQGKVAAENWNAGLERATGKYLILMHHDETMGDADYLEQVKRRMEEGAEVVISHVEVSVNGKKKRSHFTTGIKQFVCRHPAYLFLFNVIGPCSCLTFRRETLQPFNTELRWLVDVEWYYRMLKGIEVVYDKRCRMESYHGHEGQISQHIDIPMALTEDKDIIINHHPQEKALRYSLWLYQHLILGTKQILGKI